MTPKKNSDSIVAQSKLTKMIIFPLLQKAIEFHVSEILKEVHDLQTANKP